LNNIPAAEEKKKKPEINERLTKKRIPGINKNI